MTVASDMTGVPASRCWADFGIEIRQPSRSASHWFCFAANIGRPHPDVHGPSMRTTRSGRQNLVEIPLEVLQLRRQVVTRCSDKLFNISDVSMDDLIEGEPSRLPVPTPDIVQRSKAEVSE